MIELILPDMSCGHCEKTVRATVLALDPEATVLVDLPAHRLQIASVRDPAAFVAALAEEGYPAAA